MMLYIPNSKYDQGHICAKFTADMNRDSRKRSSQHSRLVNEVLNIYDFSHKLGYKICRIMRVLIGMYSEEKDVWKKYTIDFV